MATPHKNSLVPRLLAVLFVCILTGGGIYFYFQSQITDYTITFANSKQVAEGAGVLLSGIEIGRVVSVKPFGTGVAIGIRVDREYQAILTEASRFFLDGEGEKGRLLVKNISPTAIPLKPGQIVEGTDSSFQWAAYDYVRGMNTFFESRDFREEQKAIRTYVDDLNRQLSLTDWNKLGRDMQLQMETFSTELEEILDNEDVKNFHQELEKKF